MSPFLGSMNLLEWLTELGKPIYLLDYDLIIKGYNSKIAGWKRCQGPGVGKGEELTLSPSAALSCSSRCSPAQKPFEPVLRAFVEASLHRCD